MLFRSFKGVGAAGEAITADQEAFLQSKVNEWNARFLADVASGRSMSGESVAAVADGRWWSAADAVGLGLVDQIGSMDQVLEAIRAQKGESMGKQTLQPATAAEAPAAAVELPPVVATVETVTGPDLGAYMAAFGDLEGARMFRDGLSFSDAQAKHLETLQGTIQDLRAELAGMKNSMASMAELVKGETTPINTPAGVRRSLSDAFNARKN